MSDRPWLLAAQHAAKYGGLSKLADLVRPFDDVAADVLEDLVARAPSKGDIAISARRTFLFMTDNMITTKDQRFDVIKREHFSGDPKADDRTFDVIGGRPARICQPARELLNAMSHEEKAHMESRIKAVIENSVKI